MQAREAAGSTADAQSSIIQLGHALRLRRAGSIQP
jgi:hypothetical protein